ncbi:MAG TPA: hypothetical protein VFX58_15660, partial [Chitinophagaceae bacterium]|nr:hypothetical protein [Chitinophagaceae bacterium]
SFGNLEFKTIPQPDAKEVEYGKEQTDPKEGPGKILKKIDELLREYEKDEKKLESIQLLFKGQVSKNPHAYYEVTIDNTTESINPSPPDPPSDY